MQNKWTDKYPLTVAYPDKPRKPKDTINGSSSDAEIAAYRKAQDEYVIAYRKYQDDIVAYRKASSEQYDQIKSAMLDECGFSKYPIEVQEAVWSKAWDEGHSAGYHDVENCLHDLYDLVETIYNCKK